MHLISLTTLGVCPIIIVIFLKLSILGVKQVNKLARVNYSLYYLGAEVECHVIAIFTFYYSWK